MRQTLVYDCVNADVGEIRAAVACHRQQLGVQVGPLQGLHRRARRHPAREDQTPCPDTNGVVERFNSTLKCEHLYRRPIPDAATLIDEVDSLIGFYNSRRPHQALGRRRPLEAYREDGLSRKPGQKCPRTLTRYTRSA
ncbi:MAG TPA: hypothetical protein DCP20_04345 [Coriobacteriia bacterium]|nr:hypothetical protein [Coriobacteriia bacterium]